MAETAQEQLGSLRFLNTQTLQTSPSRQASSYAPADIYSKPASKQSKGFNSTTTRFDASGKANLGPASYAPAFQSGANLSTSNRGTGAFANTKKRFGQKKNKFNVGPGSHNLGQSVMLKTDHSRGKTSANYAPQVSSRHAKYAPSTKYATPGPNAYTTTQNVTTTRTQISGVFTSKTERSGPIAPSLHPERQPGPGDYDSGFADRRRLDSKATAALRTTTQRFKQPKAQAPPPGSYDPMHTQTKTRAPFGKQNHRELVPHFKQQFTMRHAPPAKSKHPGPANYNLTPMEGPKFTGNSSMFRSRSHRTQMDQELARMQRVKATPGPGAYGKSTSEAVPGKKASHHYNPSQKWI